jgi:hypothetical protein
VSAGGVTKNRGEIRYPGFFGTLSEAIDHFSLYIDAHRFSAWLDTRGRRYQQTAGPWADLKNPLAGPQAQSLQSHRGTADLLIKSGF